MKIATSAANAFNKWFAFVADTSSVKKQPPACNTETNVVFGTECNVTPVSSPAGFTGKAGKQINHISNDPSIPGSFSFLPPGSSSKTFFMKQILLRLQISVGFLAGLAQSFFNKFSEGGSLPKGNKSWEMKTVYVNSQYSNTLPFNKQAMRNFQPAANPNKFSFMKKILHKTGVFVVTLMIANLFLLSNASGQNTWTLNGTGNWKTTGNWSSGHVPLATENVVIGSFNFGNSINGNATINGTNAVCASLQLGRAGGQSTATGAITFASTGSPSLTVSGAVILGGTNNNGGSTGTITFQSGSTLTAGSLQLGNTGGGGSAGVINMSSGGTLSVNGAITVQTVTGNTWTPGTGTVILNANNTLPSTIFTSFNNLNINGGTTTLGVNTTVAGALTVNAGASLALGTRTLGSPTGLTMFGGATTASSITGTGTLTLGGNVSVNDATTGTAGATISTPVALGATRTFTVADDGTSATDLTISGVISGTGSGLTKAGAGTMSLSGTNTYTGTTTISGGVLQLGATNVISNSSNFILSGGTFRSGATTGFSETVGTLSLSASSTIALGTGNHTITFANSGGASWTAGQTLTITGWTGTAGASGTNGKIMVGASGLSTTQLSQITFSGFTAGAMILASGELVPALQNPNLAIAGTLNNG